MAATAFQKLVHDLCQAGFLETGIELEHVRACQFPLVADEQGNPSKIKTNPHPQLFCESLQSFPILQLNRACPKIEELSKGSFGTVWRFQPQTCTEIQGSCIIKIQKIDMDVQTDASRVHIRAQRMLERETATNDFVCNGYISESLGLYVLQHYLELRDLAYKNNSNNNNLLLGQPWASFFPKLYATLIVEVDHTIFGMTIMEYLEGFTPMDKLILNCYGRVKEKKKSLEGLQVAFRRLRDFWRIIGDEGAPWFHHHDLHVGNLLVNEQTGYVANIDPGFCAFSMPTYLVKTSLYPRRRTLQDQFVVIKTNRVPQCGGIFNYHYIWAHMKGWKPDVLDMFRSLDNNGDVDDDDDSVVTADNGKPMAVYRSNEFGTDLFSYKVDKSLEDRVVMSTVLVTHFLSLVCPESAMQAKYQNPKTSQEICDILEQQRAELHEFQQLFVMNFGNLALHSLYSVLQNNMWKKTKQYMFDCTRTLFTEVLRCLDMIDAPLTVSWGNRKVLASSSSSSSSLSSDGDVLSSSLSSSSSPSSDSDSKEEDDDSEEEEENGWSAKNKKKKTVEEEDYYIDESKTEYEFDIVQWYKNPKQPFYDLCCRSAIVPTWNIMNITLACTKIETSAQKLKALWVGLKTRLVLHQVCLIVLTFMNSYTSSSLQQPMNHDRYAPFLDADQDKTVGGWLDLLKYQANYNFKHSTHKDTVVWLVDMAKRFCKIYHIQNKTLLAKAKTECPDFCDIVMVYTMLLKIMMQSPKFISEILSKPIGTTTTTTTTMEATPPPPLSLSSSPQQQQQQALLLFLHRTLFCNTFDLWTEIEHFGKKCRKVVSRKLLPVLVQMEILVSNGARKLWLQEEQHAGQLGIQYI